jgi:hypothetical protein
MVDSKFQSREVDMSQTKKKRVETRRMILAQFPITNEGVIPFNCEVESKKDGLRRAQKMMGQLTPIPLKGRDDLSAFVDQQGRKFVLFWGRDQLKLLAKLITREIDAGTIGIL